VIFPCFYIMAKRLGTEAIGRRAARTREILPGCREYVSIGKWEEDGTGRKSMLSGAASQRSMAQLECNQQPLSIVLTG
jgi:hypothetical protein